MMEHAPAVQFKSSQSVEKISLNEAILSAKNALTLMTDLVCDSVASCEQGQENGWQIELDAVESAARMGDNDLLVTYLVCLDNSGELTRISRVRRYYREEG